MIMAKIAKHEGKYNTDRLSGLPDSILSRILSLLPTRDAVRTSVLSSNWRFLYTSVSALDFRFIEDRHCPPYDFMKFVDRVLLLHDATCIEKFRLNLLAQFTRVDISRFSSWISFALERRLQELHLDVSFGIPYVLLPDSFFSSKTLVKVELTVPRLIMVLPSTVCFPSLKSLHLKYVIFAHEDSAPRLFSGCLVLVDLFITSCTWYAKKFNISNFSLKRLALDHRKDLHVDVAIDCPSLVYLELSDDLLESLSSINLLRHSLAEANLINLCWDGDGLVNHDAANKFFNGISNVGSLSCNYDLLWHLTLCDVKPMRVFHNLVHLEIGKKGTRQRSGLVELIQSSINLETLIFLDGDVSWHPPENVPSCLSFRLKVIEFYSFGDDLEMLKYFLMNARVLEKVRIQVFLRMTNRLKDAIKLLMLSRESKICQVELG